MFPADDPQWRVTNILSDDNQSAWVFAFNHGIDDQQSVNILTQDLLGYISSNNPEPVSLPLPPNVEKAICPGPPNLLTLLWSLYQMYNSIRMPKVVPRRIEEGLKTHPESFLRYTDPDQRRTICELVTLSEEATARLRRRSKEEGVTVTSALTAAMLVINSLLLQENSNSKFSTSLDDMTLRFLLSVGLRPFGVQSKNSDDWSGGSVACAGGALDFVIRVPSEACSPLTREFTAESNESLQIDESFWDLARRSQDISKFLIKVGFVPESQRLFGIGMEVVDILKAVEIEARNPASLGRGYTCGVSSMGVVNFRESVAAVKGVFYGTSHGRNGVLSLLSCMTVNGVFTGCLQFPSPLIDRERAEKFKNILEKILVEL